MLFLPFRNEESEIEKADCEKLFYDNLSTIQKNKSEYCLIKDNCLEDALKYTENEMYIEENDDNFIRIKIMIFQINSKHTLQLKRKKNSYS